MKLSQLIVILAIILMVSSSFQKKNHLRDQLKKHHLHHHLKSQQKAHALTSSPLWRSLIVNNTQQSDCKPIQGRQEQDGGLLRREKSQHGLHTDMNRIRVSSGYAAYYLDITDSLFLDKFKSNLVDNFNSFSSLNQQSTTNLNIYEKQEKKLQDGNKYINYVQLTEGMVQFGWKIGTEAKDLIRKYDINGDYLLNFKEFAYLNIFENIKFGPSSSTKNVLNNVKSEIYDFFDYVDCDKDGFVSSEDIHKAFKGINTEFKVLATMVNDFVLKTMELSSATLDVKDYSFGQLLGMFERVVGKHGIDETDLNRIKLVRKTNALKGGLENNGEGKKCGQ